MFGGLDQTFPSLSPSIPPAIIKPLTSEVKAGVSAELRACSDSAPRLPFPVATSSLALGAAGLSAPRPVDRPAALTIMMPTCV